MKKRMIMIAACCLCLGLMGCGSENESESTLQVEAVSEADSEADQEPTAAPEEAHQEATSEAPAETEQEANTEDQTAPEQDAAQGTITEDQALNAIRNYCFSEFPDLKDMYESGDYTIYWDVSTNENNEIVVLYRSYTAAEIRYYIDPRTGDAYTTELVPGIIDEEQRTDETLNIRDYIE